MQGPRGISVAGYTPRGVLAPSIRMKMSFQMRPYGGPCFEDSTGCTSLSLRSSSSRSSAGYTAPERTFSMMPASPPVPDIKELVNKRTEAAESFYSNLLLGTFLAAGVIGDTLLLKYKMMPELVNFLGLDKVTAAVATAPFAAAALAALKQNFYDELYSLRLVQDKQEQLAKKRQQAAALLQQRRTQEKLAIKQLGRVLGQCYVRLLYGATVAELEQQQLEEEEQRAAAVAAQLQHEQLARENAAIKRFGRVLGMIYIGTTDLF